MSKLSKSDVGRILAVELSFYQHMPVTKELIAAWHLHFRYCEAGEFFSALHIAVAQSAKGFPPTPGEVWVVIRKLRATPESLETADQAWSMLISNKAASERAKAATALMPDWKNRGAWLVEHMPFRKKEFERIYNDLKERDEILETQNIARSELGYSRDPLPEIADSLMMELGW